MKVVIDTNSLLSLVRYYLPFDDKSILYEFFKTKIEKKEIIIIDKILEECEYTAKGAVLESLDYLSDKAYLRKSKLPINTEFILAPSPARFLRQVDNHFINGAIRRSLTEAEYENRKSDFMDSADVKLILYCLNLKKDHPFDAIYLVTEETEGSNDNKAFKKIPAICKILELETINLPQLLKMYEQIGMHFK